MSDTRTNDPVTAHELRQIVESYHLGRCYACGWPLSPNRDSGCVPGDCSFRPDEVHPQHHGWKVRMEILSRVAAEIRRLNYGQ